MKNNNSFSLSGNIVDIVAAKIFKGTVYIEDGHVRTIEKDDSVKETHYILPGLIDAHIHIESSMLVPSEFARLAVVHGTVATVSDPHEIGNVLGIEGVNYMIRNGKKVPFKFYFGAPSCVPATPFETAGAKIGVNELDELLRKDEIKYLSEMMNFPGVINGDRSETDKLDVAKKYGKPVDGHAPGVKGEAARKYIEAGITTDHECFTMEEALEKIKYGMKIQIREGSAAKNFDALVDLLAEHADHVLFCSDDKHPDDLVKGHINQLVVRAIQKGHDPMKVLRSAILNPIRHYGLEVGILQPGDPADLIVVDKLTDFNVKATFVNGIKVAENGKSLIDAVENDKPNQFKAQKINTADIRVQPDGHQIKVIKAFDGQLITALEEAEASIENDNVVSNPEQDVLKLVVVNRYAKAKPAVAFIRGFGFKNGAIASSVAHDSHNIVAVGVSDKDIVRAINLVIEEQGGVVAVDAETQKVLPLPVAGLMSVNNAYQVAESYHQIDRLSHQMGSKLRAPFMTLSFMALLVIPELKLSDKGLFDGTTFSFTRLFA